jgi:hypothetical protein
MDRLQEALAEDVVEPIRETLGEEFETIQNILSDQSEQIGRLHESVTGVQDGPGGREPPNSNVDIGNMLAALHIIFEPQLKAKAFLSFLTKRPSAARHKEMIKVIWRKHV